MPEALCEGRVTAVKISDLGPLEQAILRATVAAESLGVPQDAASIHRLLPGYRTHARNVTAALADDRPVRRWLLAEGPFYVFRDRADSAVGVAAGRRRAETAWTERSGLIRGMSKLPWVEAVAAVGPFAQGILPKIESPLDLVVIAEGGRTDLARRALGAFRRARRSSSDRLRVVSVLDADSLALEPESDVEALLWATLQPVVCAEAWVEFSDVNPWLRRRFPNWHSLSREVPGLVSNRRLDGRLARLRRSAVSMGAGGLLGSEGRRPGLLTAIEERAGRRLALGDDLGVLASLPSGTASEYQVRLDGIRTWAFESVASESTSLEVEEDGVEETSMASEEGGTDERQQPEPPEKAPRTVSVSPSEDGEESASADDVGGTGTSLSEESAPSVSTLSSRRKRGPVRRSARKRRASSSPESGQKGRGGSRRGKSRTR